MAQIRPLTGNHGDFSGIVLKAAASGNAEAVRHYLSINPARLHDKGPHGRTLLWEAVYKGRHALVKELINLGADVNAPGSYYTPLLVDPTHTNNQDKTVEEVIRGARQQTNERKKMLKTLEEY